MSDPELVPLTAPLCEHGQPMERTSYGWRCSHERPPMTDPSILANDSPNAAAGCAGHDGTYTFGCIGCQHEASTHAERARIIGIIEDMPKLGSRSAFTVNVTDLLAAIQEDGNENVPTT